MDVKKIIETEMTEQDMSKLSRRDAIKLMGMSPIAAGVIASAGSSTYSEANASSATGKIVIVGGGLAGTSTAARLCTLFQTQTLL